MFNSISFYIGKDKIRSGTSYDELEKSLASEQLYPLCGVIRQTKPVGHPKKETVRS